ncbi:MAG: YjiG family protein [Acidaminococcaceae bacterium]|nr:YjiG family protein [Acidaminococcaceae bacterium]
MSQQDMEVQQKLSPMDVFVKGALKGWDIGIKNIIPNVIMAFVCIQILTVTGAMTWLGKVFAPVMAVFGLPGEAVTVLIGALMSMGGAVGVAMALISSNILDGNHAAILMPAIYLMGSKIQYLGRLLGTVGVPGKYWGILLGISIFNACVGMVVMRFLLVFFK